ncbi:hypothetical protein MES4922_260047 [Mesorhizobium ventifaucium]|uniref:Uncharacterized protein n=1 Tax=Mesorhizobium ventifaucium TaxID=666020 RepID=A0ABN8JT65_9HYPH|nr:hypothetical protein MES4922_260047 [Mesorhizobium ventifaucium]
MLHCHALSSRANPSSEQGGCRHQCGCEPPSARPTLVQGLGRQIDLAHKLYQMPVWQS